MARTIFEVEVGLGITDENGNSPISIIRGSAAPGGTTGTDGANQAALYMREDGTLYQKKSAGSGSDKWIRIVNADDLASFSWREEKVVAATGDVAPATGSTIDLSVSPFGDDEGTQLSASDFSVGDHIIFGVGGAPKLMQVTAVASPNITVEDAPSPMSDNDMYIVRYYLPDSPDSQEKQAIVLYNGAGIIKISDFNWDIATGINLSGGYAAASGNVDSSDTVESALQKVDGVNDAQDTSLGLSQGATDFGTFTGATLPDNSSAKALFQAQETAYEETDQNVDDLITLSGVAENSTDLGSFTGDLLADGLNNKSALQRIEDLLDQLKMKEVSGITTEVSVDEVPTSSYPACTWILEATEDAAPSNKTSQYVHAMNDGTLVDDSVFGKNQLGSGVDLTVSVDVSGGNMRLRASAPSATTVRARRIGIFDIA